MAWVAVDMFGCERVYEQKPRRFVNCALEARVLQSLLLSLSSQGI